MPLGRLELPEPAPRMFGVGIGAAGVVQAELTADQTTTTPDPDAPVFQNEGENQLRFDFKLPAGVPVTLSARGWGGELFGAQLKWHALAPGRSGRGSVALTAAYGKGRTDFEFDSFGDFSRTEIEQRMTDVAAVFGWRVARQWLLFGGPFYSRHLYEGDYFSERGSDPDVTLDFEGRGTLTGVNLALGYLPLDWLAGAVEASWAQAESGQVRDSLVAVSGTLQFSFGRLTRSPASEREPPVEVVPPVRE